MEVPVSNRSVLVCDKTMKIVAWVNLWKTLCVFHFPTATTAASYVVFRVVDE
jgi:hypothetical protein